MRCWMVSDLGVAIRKGKWNQWIIVIISTVMDQKCLHNCFSLRWRAGLCSVEILLWKDMVILHSVPSYPIPKKILSFRGLPVPERMKTTQKDRLIMHSFLKPSVYLIAARLSHTFCTPLCEWWQCCCLWYEQEAALRSISLQLVS